MFTCIHKLARFAGTKYFPIIIIYTLYYSFDIEMIIEFTRYSKFTLEKFSYKRAAVVHTCKYICNKKQHENGFVWFRSWLYILDKLLSMIRDNPPFSVFLRQYDNIEVTVFL